MLLFVSHCRASYSIAEMLFCSLVLYSFFNFIFEKWNPIGPDSYLFKFFVYDYFTKENILSLDEIIYLAGNCFIAVIPFPNFHICLLNR